MPTWTRSRISGWRTWTSLAGRLQRVPVGVCKTSRKLGRRVFERIVRHSTSTVGGPQLPRLVQLFFFLGRVLRYCAVGSIIGTDLEFGRSWVCFTSSTKPMMESLL